jgi:hypothetical protein
MTVLMEVGDRDHHLSIDTRLLVMTSAASELQAQLSELNELRERVRKAELARRSAWGADLARSSRRVGRRKERLEPRSRFKLQN